MEVKSLRSEVAMGIKVVSFVLEAVVAETILVAQKSAAFLLMLTESLLEIDNALPYLVSIENWFPFEEIHGKSKVGAEVTEDDGEDDEADDQDDDDFDDDDGDYSNGGGDDDDNEEGDNGEDHFGNANIGSNYGDDNDDDDDEEDDKDDEDLEDEEDVYNDYNENEPPAKKRKGN